MLAVRTTGKNRNKKEKRKTTSDNPPFFCTHYRTPTPVQVDRICIFTLCHAGKWGVFIKVNKNMCSVLDVVPGGGGGVSVRVRNFHVPRLTCPPKSLFVTPFFPLPKSAMSSPSSSIHPSIHPSLPFPSDTEGPPQAHSGCHAVKTPGPPFLFTALLQMF
jgi:hypothetical protein